MSTKLQAVLTAAENLKAAQKALLAAHEELAKAQADYKSTLDFLGTAEPPA